MTTLAPTLTLWDWRRRTAALWQDIRAAGTPEAGWTLWKDTRAELFAHHPQTPLDPGGEMPIEAEIRTVRPSTS